MPHKFHHIISRTNCTMAHSISPLNRRTKDYKHTRITYRTNECRSKIQGNKLPYKPHIFDQLNIHTCTSALALQSILLEAAYRETNDSKPAYLNDAAFALCLDVLKLNFNSKAFATIDTNVAVPAEVKLMLSYGPKFSLRLPITKERTTLLFNAINALNNLHLAIYECRTLIAIAEEHIKHTDKLKTNTPTNAKLFYTHIYNCTIRFFDENKQLIMAQADKGKVSIIISKDKYIEKVHSLLDDATTYNPINVSAHTSLQKINERILNDLASHGLIKARNIPTMLANEQKIANMYGLVKIHKETQPIRPIVNTRAAPGYAIAKIVSQIISLARDTNTNTTSSTPSTFSTESTRSTWSRQTQSPHWTSKRCSATSRPEWQSNPYAKDMLMADSPNQFRLSF